MKTKINENQKVTLTIGQLKRMVKESADSDFVIDEDGWLLRYKGHGGDVVIPDGVIGIAEAAFIHNPELISIVIPGTVTTIEKYAFFECYNLKSVIISDGVKSIGFRAFEGCNKLESISIPASVTSIAHCAFDWCHNLKDVNIANPVLRDEAISDPNDIFAWSPWSKSIKDWNADMKLNENTKVTLTVGQLKKLVNESEDAVGSGQGDKDIERVGEVLGELYRTAAGEGDYSYPKRLQCAEKLNKIIQLIDQALIKSMSEPVDPRISAAYHAVDALIEELRA